MTRNLLIAVTVAVFAIACGDKAPADAPKVEPAPTEAPAAAVEEKAAPAPAAKLDYPGTEEGAKALLAAFVASGADTASLSASLRPRATDYAGVFVGDAAGKIKAVYEPAWDAGQMHIRPKAGQSEVLLFAATTEQLKAGDEAAKAFPGGYAQVAEHLQPGLTLYRFKFVEPGKDIGMAFDGLVHVDGRWTVFPKPWRALR